MTDPNQIQQIAESIALNTLNGGNLRGLVFRHDDSAQKAKSDVIVVQADAPVPQLEGPRGYRVNVRIELKSAKSERLASIHGEALRRITYPADLSAGAIAADYHKTFWVIDEEISGDRNDSTKLRKRGITVPFWLQS